MKKVKTCRILLTALLLLVVVGIVVYRLMLSTPSEELSPKARVAAILEEGGCLSCHTANAELPFYADFPLAGDLIKADIEEGYRAFDIAPLMENPIIARLYLQVVLVKVMLQQ